MTNIELYINNRLCAIKDPQNLGVRLNRVLISPAELTMKDAQYSYSVSIPTTTVNDSIFGYANVEEVRNKFNQSYMAQLYVDGVCVFDGQFRLTEIDADGNYKGNLLVPVPKTVKELFGEKKMNQIGDWKFYLSQSGNENGDPMGMAEMINKINAAKGTPDCIFPFVLYGLLPKVAKDDEGNYSEKDTWDETVRVGIEDFAPSINCLQTIKRIFENYKDAEGKPYQIGGSAFNDPRLLNLYMSYSNPTDYEQQWNWAHLGAMEISGTWYNAKPDDYGYLKDLESKSVKSTGTIYLTNNKEETQHFVVTNLFNAKNSKIEVLKDTGYNIFQFKSTYNKEEIKNTSIKIPVSGFYKITLRADIELLGTNKLEYLGGVYKGSISRLGFSSNSIHYVYSNFGEQYSILNGIRSSRNLFNSLRSEIKLVRTKDGDLDITEQQIDGIYFRNNFKQLDDRNKELSEQGFQKFDSFPKYFPQERSVLWVDPYQNKNFICGLHWGKRAEKGNYKQANPTDTRTEPCHVMAAKSGISWSADNDDVVYCVTDSPGYWTYKSIKQPDESGLESTNEDGEESTAIGVSDLGYVLENKFGMSMPDLEPKNNIQRNHANEDKKEGFLNEQGSGCVSVVMWLDKGDQLSVLDVMDVSANGSGKLTEGYCVAHNITFNLKIEPFKKSTDWAKVKMDGTGISSMKWDDTSDFNKNYINLTDFLPSEQKIDEWLENFCKAFNLDLLQPQAGQFELNLKRSAANELIGSVLNLDNKVSLLKRTNQPLNLPSQIDVSFKTDEEEEGYDQLVREKKEAKDENIVLDKGNGILETGSLFGSSLAQSSSFSYNWFKILKCNVFSNDLSQKTPQNIYIPVISNKEAWENKADYNDYAEMMKKIYTNYPQRFWYRSDVVYNLGSVWQNRYLGEVENFTDQYQPLYIYPLSNTYASEDGNNKLVLNYHDEAYSILRSYFTLITTEDSNYTLVECYLTPDEYEQLSYGKLVSINSDLYYVGSIENYDPTGKNQTKLKLIRKI